MKIINNLRDFLIDHEYYIDIFEDKLHAYNYQKLLKLNDKDLMLKFENVILNNTPIINDTKENIRLLLI